jgi:CheY-like chemotaxis protein/glycine cleavage system H lipoate-binding protein
MSKQYDLLVIDDEPVVLDAVVRVCGAHGINVDVAPDSHAGLHRLHTNRYRLVLCDIMMPDLDGFQLLRRVLEETRDTPVVMTTGYSTIEHAVRSLSGGAIGYLPKPFTEEELISAIHRGLTFSTMLRSGDVGGACPERYYRLGFISWARLEETGAAFIGVADLFLKTLGLVKEVRFVSPHEELVQGTTCARISSTTDLVHDVLSPISGKILEINATLLGDVGILQRDPYLQGWLYRIVPEDIEYEVKHLTVGGFVESKQ